MFTLAGRQVGSVVVNRIRLLSAIVFLTAAHFLLRVPLPLHASPDRYLWLSLSGVIGLTLGDAFLFQAYLWIGPRLSMLLLSLAPVLAALLAWMFLNENLTTLQVLGILLTLAGVIWVVLEENGNTQKEPTDKRTYSLGILFGLGAATGQALGLITAKRGLGGDFPALSGTLIRMIAAAVALWAFTFLRGHAGETMRQVSRNPKVIWLILAGALAGPTLGVTLNLFAIQKIEIGVASTLAALPPVILLPVSYFYFKERFGWQAILGTLVAMSGVALLFLV